MVHTEKALELPNQAKMVARNAVHCPYRCWCEVCVAASFKEEAHARSSNVDVETGLQVVSLEYDFLKGPVNVVIGTVRRSGAALAYTCTAKAPTEQWVVKQLVPDLEA